MIVLDTHVWVWLVSHPERLSPRARKQVNRAIEENAVYISCISAWEVALLAATGRLQFTLQVAEWIARCETLPFLNFVPVDNRIVLQSVYLPAPLHPDPADRMIVATALTLGAALITKDEKLLSYPHVQTIW